MIPCSFEYYKPENCLEVSDIFSALVSENKHAFYYSGGTEIITMSRTFSIKPDAVIDLKGIYETQDMKVEGNKLIIGSNVTLSRISESKLFPLLGTTVSRIADHTNQNRITLGGNICGTIIYKEAALPMLLADSDVVVFSNGIEKQVPLNSIFDKRLNISANEFVIKFITDTKFTNLPYIHVKKTKNEKIDYPLLTTCAIRYEGKIRMAFSGLSSYPLRSLEVERIINDSSLTKLEKAQEIFINLSSCAVDSVEGSKEYKMFVLKNTILDILNDKGITNDSL